MALTQVNINKANLNHNIAQYHKLSPDLPIWPVIKSNAYGHGLQEVAKILDTNQQVSGFMVVNLTEALALAKFTSKPIMVLSYFDRAGDDLALAAENKISLPVYDLATAEYLNNLNKKFLVNIKIDTGTSRLGFGVGEAEEAIKKIQTLTNLQINSLYTHYAESESDDQTFTLEQWEKFKNITDKFPQYKKHSACSSATLSQMDKHGGLIRLGLALYGLWPSLATKVRGERLGINLKPVLSWQTKVIQLKKIKAGDTIGYNRTYKCTQDCQIATLPIGYHEGYDRGLSNKAEVLIQNQRCKVRGNICMNLTMVELPAKMKVETGEVADLINSEITADELAEVAGTINYEIVTRINNNLPRVIV